MVKLRVLAFGAARTSAAATDWEIVVMRAPRQGDRGRCCNREPDSARALSRAPTGKCDRVPAACRERRDSRCVDRQNKSGQIQKRRFPMRQKLYLSALVAASLIGTSCSALAQTAGAGAGGQVAPGM